MSFVANSSCLASPVVIGCCFYPITPLVSTNNTFSNGFPVLTTGFYGIRNNINFGCNNPCFPDFLTTISGSTNNFLNGKSKLRIGDPVGNIGGRIIGIPSNNFVS